MATMRYPPRSRASPARPAAPAATSGSSAGPQFASLVRLALESSGVRYVSVDLLRKAKRNSTSQRERLVLWKLLHDLVLLELADFDVDFEEMERMNADDLLEDALNDTEQHRVRVEIVQYYMYDWGFLCRHFFEPEPPSQVLLLAFAWLAAYSRLFERRHQEIVQSYLGVARAQLPPFPNDVAVDDTVVAEAVEEALDALASASEAVPIEEKTHQLHLAYGRLQHSMNELAAYHRCHQRLLNRLGGFQQRSISVPDKTNDQKENDTLPAWVIQLLTLPKTQLEAQIRIVSCSLQLLNDEVLFYKWINGIVVEITASSDHALTEQRENMLMSQLNLQAQRVDALLQAEEYQKLSQSFKAEWKKWRQQVKNSRSRIERMEAKFEGATQEIQRSEFFDPQKIFFVKPPRRRESHPSSSLVDAHSFEVELERLESQLERVLGEIMSEYCCLTLR